MKPRHRAPVLHPLRSMTDEEHAAVKRLAIKKEVDWSTSDGPHGVLIKKFREEIKEHYFTAQRRRCCYCSIELHDHKITYDAEHILDKSEYPEYMFEPGNLAASCRLCNQSKSNRSVSASGVRFTKLSSNKDDYSVLHPHLDEWHDHLTFDLIGRITPVELSAKGPETIRICGMAALNATRLADEFSLADHKEAETALRTFHEVPGLAKKRDLLELLETMARRYDHAGSKSVMSSLKEDVRRLELEEAAQAINSEAQNQGAPLRANQRLVLRRKLLPAPSTGMPGVPDVHQ